MRLHHLLDPIIGPGAEDNNSCACYDSGWNEMLVRRKAAH
jgi:hypothetical protein